MKNSIKKFLQFNGKNIYFLAIDGQYWIAVKPVCEALGVDYIQQFKNLKEHQILKQLLCEHTMVGADNRLRKMISLPEKFFYGWLFGIQSSSPDLINYQFKCHEILFDHFHGSITERQSVLKEKSKLLIEIEKLQDKIKDNDDIKKLNKLKAELKDKSRSLTKMDVKIVSSQLDLWKQEFES